LRPGALLFLQILQCENEQTLIPAFSRFDFAQRQEKEEGKNTLPLGEGRVRVLERGEMDIKGKGKMRTYFLER
jgi:hypothetical protein